MFAQFKMIHMVGDIMKGVDLNLLVPAIITFILIVFWDIWRDKPRIKFGRIYAYKSNSNFKIQTWLTNAGRTNIPNIEYDIRIADVSLGKYKEDTDIQLPIFKELYSWHTEAPSGIGYTGRSEIFERGKRAMIDHSMESKDLSPILDKSKYFTIMIRVRSPIMKITKEILCQSVSEADKPYWLPSWCPHKNIRRPRWFWLNLMKIVLGIERKIRRCHQLNYQKYRTL